MTKEYLGGRYPVYDRYSVGGYLIDLAWDAGHDITWQLLFEAKRHGLHEQLLEPMPFEHAKEFVREMRIRIDQIIEEHPENVSEGFFNLKWK